jgi:hypothetical protein
LNGSGFDLPTAQPKRRRAAAVHEIHGTGRRPRPFVHRAFSRMDEFVSVGSGRGQECALGDHRDDAATCVALVARHETGP